MTTLDKKQVKFLSGYATMLIEDDIESKVKALRETDEWKDAVEEGKKDKEVLVAVGTYHKQLNDEQSAYTLSQELKGLNENLKIAEDSPFRDGLRSVTFKNRTDEAIQELVDSQLVFSSTTYARKKTGFISFTSTPWSTINKVEKEMNARLSVTAEDDFDTIVDSLISKFDTQKLVDAIVENNKD